MFLVLQYSADLGQQCEIKQGRSSAIAKDPVERKVSSSTWGLGSPRADKALQRLLKTKTASEALLL